MVTKNKSISIEAYNKEQNKPFTVYDFDNDMLKFCEAL